MSTHYINVLFFLPFYVHSLYNECLLETDKYSKGALAASYINTLQWYEFLS
jgi:hypothetical protein